MHLNYVIPADQAYKQILLLMLQVRTAFYEIL